MGSIDNRTLITIASVVLIIDCLIGILFNSTLQTVYPLKQVPWAMPSQREMFIYEITLYLYSISMAFNSSVAATKYLLGIAGFLTFLTNLYPLTYYDSLVTKSAAFNSAILISILSA